MAEFYRSHYRKQHLVPLPYNGKLAKPGTPEFELAIQQRGEIQADLALYLGKVQPGERILDVGCRRGRTLHSMMQKVDIQAYGIEPDENEAAMATSHGIQMHAGVIETFAPGDLRFDQIQMLHVLEHLHDPLQCLIHLRSLLKPNGRLVIEVPDMMAPVRTLKWFFQYPHLYSFSKNTLSALFLRAGLEPVDGLFSGTIMLMGTPMGNAIHQRKPFHPSMMNEPTHDGSWVANRLLTYNGLETVRRQIKAGIDISPKLLAALLKRHSLPIQQKTSMTHTAEVTLDLVEWMSTQQRIGDAAHILESVITGPHDPAFIEMCRQALEQIRRIQPKFPANRI